MSTGIESAMIGEAFKKSFDSEAAIRKPLSLITTHLQKSEKFNELLKRQVEGVEPFFDFPSITSSALLHAFNSSVVCEVLFSEYRELFIKNQISLAPLMRTRHLLEGGIVMNLQNCCTFMTGPTAAALLNDSHRKKIKNAFAENFPKLVDARDALAHEHDRSVGKFRNSRISDVGQSTNSAATGIAGLIDQKGVKFDFDFSSAKIIALAQQVADIICEV